METKSYYQTHKEKQNAYHKRWLKEHPQYAYKRVLQWREDNPEKYKKAKKRASGKFLYGMDRDIILKKDGYKCKMCGSSEKLEIHHIDGKGSSYLGKRLKLKEKNNDLSNLITLCHNCHRKVDGWKAWVDRKKSWSVISEKCVICGTNKVPHQSQGLCGKCYERTRKEYKKQWYLKHKKV